jgi:DNA-binding NtrC family response regulator
VTPRDLGPDDDRSTLVQHHFDASERPEDEFVLAVVAGPDTGKTFVVDGSEPSPPLLGKSPACSMRLGDPSVSRRHLSLEIHGTGLRVRDLGSLNGTFADAVQVHDVTLRGGETLRLERRARGGEDLVPYADRFGRLIGASREMRRLYPLCDKLAESSFPLVIEGETGTGKEVLAEAIHEKGPRASGPFVVFECTATPANLMEAELFGYEKGAFTGAAARHRGVFEQADGGTLLIDEIGDLPLPEQVKLLRVIERGEFRRLGGERPTRVDVRLIAATRRNLDQEVEAGRFRDDLFHRLAVARIELPALRNRRGDVPLLAASLWQELGGTGPLPHERVARWERHDWPGNVRELRNAVARFLTLGDLATVEPGSARAPMRAGARRLDALVDELLARELPLAVVREHLLDEFERRYLEDVLARHGGVVTKAADAAGIARRHFHRLLNRASLTRTPRASARRG